MRNDEETVSNATEQRASPRVETSPRLAQRPHRPQLISPGIACYVWAPLSPPKNVKSHPTLARMNFDVIWMQEWSPEKEPLKPCRSLSLSATALPAALRLGRCRASERHEARSAPDTASLPFDISAAKGIRPVHG